ISAQTLTRAAALTRVLGQSGRRYFVERILQEKPGNQGRMYLATEVDPNHKYVLKSVAPRDFEYLKDMFNDLRSSHYLRVSDDACPDESVFVYKISSRYLLSFVQNDVPLKVVEVERKHVNDIFKKSISIQNLFLHKDSDDSG
ncbi:uncharacterized protein M421DRAFT_407270, partial [Didymella exigua CBS 183.55]